MAGQIGAPEMLPRLLGLAQGKVADQAIELTDAQDVRRAGRLRLCEITVERIGDGALRRDGGTAEHQLVSELHLVFCHQVRCSIAVTRSCTEFLDRDPLVAERDCSPDIENAVFPTGTEGEHVIFSSSS